MIVWERYMIVAEISLIALTFMLALGLLIFLAGAAGPRVPFRGTFEVEVERGKTLALIKHMGGENCPDAFDFDPDGEDNWRNLVLHLEVEADGEYTRIERVGNIIEAISFGKKLDKAEQGVDLETADRFKVDLGRALKSGDVVILFHVPSGHEIVRLRVDRQGYVS